MGGCEMRKARIRPKIQMVRNPTVQHEQEPNSRVEFEEPVESHVGALSTLPILFLSLNIVHGVVLVIL
jgi:hypothetical protein